VALCRDRGFAAASGRHIQVDVSKGYPARDNADTMVKWIKPPPSSTGSGQAAYKDDFTLFDKDCEESGAQVFAHPIPERKGRKRKANHTAVSSPSAPNRQGVS